MISEAMTATVVTWSLNHMISVLSILHGNMYITFFQESTGRSNQNTNKYT